MSTHVAQDERIQRSFARGERPVIRSDGQFVRDYFDVEDGNEIGRQYPSADKARRELGRSPLFSMEEGLKRTTEWHREFLNGGAGAVQ